ncbi:MAG: thiamine phosphate synthase [Betaproteobacteria bacterium HGW-Betaproteobacteria-22]|nr:MAG: thiamine phosphate synthase [Betaproteobacteria bacterium HGW-Betaproteobacteria-22]
MKKIAGLYAITPDVLNTDVLLANAEAALQGGVNILQYRNKLADHLLKTRQAGALLTLCREHGVPLIINDSIKLCLTLDADGVHLGADDGNLAEARARLGADKILGASCYNRFDLAISAQEAGADYVAFGACFSSSTKPHAPLATTDLFRQARRTLTIPSVAIGGITLDNAPQVIRAGANATAVINAIFSADDIKLTTQQFTKLFNHDLNEPNSI